MHADKSEVLVKDVKWNKFTMGQANCSLVIQYVMGPRPEPATGSSVQGEIKALVGPITPKAKLHYRSETTELYPCYYIRDIQSLKNK